MLTISSKYPIWLVRCAKNLANPNSNIVESGGESLLLLEQVEQLEHVEAVHVQVYAVYEQSWIACVQAWKIKISKDRKENS